MVVVVVVVVAVAVVVVVVVRLGCYYCVSVNVAVIGV